MNYKENILQTPNISENRINKCLGIIYHHTGDYSKKSVTNTFLNPESKVSAHVVIWKDGFRTVFAKDTDVAFHAGFSRYKGGNYCNSWTLGIEFEGDTTISPLTNEQVQSCLEWVKPRIRKYSIPFDMNTDHRTIRANWNTQYPDKIKAEKVDLNPTELFKLLKEIKEICY